MASVRFLLLCLLAAITAGAQALSEPNPHFEWRSDPPSPRPQVVAGYISAGGNTNQAAAVGHRYFYHAAAHTYYGYDVVIQRDGQGGGYRVMYYDLSIGPLDFSDGPADAIDLAIWKKLPLSPLPAPHTVTAGAAIENVVSVDPSTGQKLIDSLSMLPFPQAIPRIGNAPQFQVVIGSSAAQSVVNIMPLPQGQIRLRTPAVPYVVRGGGSPDGVTIPTVSGTAREFSADDAEMHIQQALISINGVKQELTSPSRVAAGSLVWFYVPQRGRYVLSLSPRAQLGFVKAGEVRGGTVSFTLGDDRVQLESPVAIAPGEAPYLLYVLHDADWAPTAQSQSSSLLFGSVSAAELAALTRK